MLFDILNDGCTHMLYHAFHKTWIIHPLDQQSFHMPVKPSHCLFILLAVFLSIFTLNLKQEIQVNFLYKPHKPDLLELKHMVLLYF